MRILFLTPQFPYPPHKGTILRNYYLIAGLTARHEIDLLTMVESEDQLRRATPLSTLCRRIDGVLVPQRGLGRRAADTILSPWPDMGLRLWSPAFAAKLDAWLADTRYDVVQFEGIEMARYMLQGARRRTQNVGGDTPDGIRSTLCVYDAHNCEYLLQRRAFETDAGIPSRWVGAAYSFVQWRKLCRFEAATCRAADRVIAVSDADAEALRRLLPGLEVTVAPNGIDVASYVAPIAGVTGGEKADLVFTATMDFRPNVDAVLWFADEVLPLIRQQEPDVRFVVVGRNPHRRLNVLRSRAEVVLTGAVDDVRPYIEGAAVYVVPLLVGGGTRFKILEAGAMGKAMVSTSLGCEGFPVQHGRELLIADSPRAFADAAVALLRDPARRAELGAAAHVFVRAFDWKNIIPTIEAVYQRAERKV